MNQSEPSATQFFLAEDIEQSEYFLPAQNMDQSEPFATEEFFLPAQTNDQS